MPHRALKLTVQPSVAAYGLTPVPSLQLSIAAQRERLIAAMLELRNLSLAPSVEEARQFVTGFVHLVESAAGGDMTPRDEYLQTVIPGIRDSGFPFEATLDSMVRVAMALAAEIDVEHRRWTADFCGDYTRHLIRAWFGGTP